MVSCHSNKCKMKLQIPLSTQGFRVTVVMWEHSHGRDRQGSGQFHPVRPKKCRIHQDGHWILRKVNRRTCQLPDVFTWPGKSNSVLPMTSSKPHLCTPATLGCMATPTSGLCTCCSLCLKDLHVPGSCHLCLSLSHLLREAFPHHSKGAKYTSHSVPLPCFIFFAALPTTYLFPCLWSASRESSHPRKARPVCLCPDVTAAPNAALGPVGGPSLC